MELENIQFAALLHDIGKFYQRTGIKLGGKYSQCDFGQNGAHGKWSADFVKEFWGDDVEDLVLYHHKPKKSNYPEMCNIITKADHHSSKERIKSDVKSDVLKSPLISISSRINLGEKGTSEHYAQLKKLDLDSFNDLKPVKSKNESSEGYNLVPNYKKLWEDFRKEISQLNNYDSFNTILALLKKYTSTMPSAAYVSESDISLFDHSKTTAALATSRYLFKKEGNNLKKSVDNQDVYLTISGDISGIQNFIYKVSSPQEAQSGMSKRLRGRSLYLTLLADAIATRIVEDIGLNQANILFCGGGRFTIIAPNTDIALKKLEKIKSDVNNLFINKFNAELYLAIAHIPCSGDDLEEFGDLTLKLSNKLSEDKKHKFINDLDKVFEIDDKSDYNGLCSVCGAKTNNIISNSFRLCNNCKGHEDLGKKVANSTVMIKCYSEDFSNEFSFYEKSLKVGYIFKNETKDFSSYIDSLAKKYEKIDVIKLNNTEFLDLANKIKSKNVSFNFSFLGNTVPKSSKTPLYFEHLAKISKGANKLGVLKMDVDDLGLIFSEGFKHLKDGKGTSISRVSTLSSSLEMFFSGFINKIAENYKIFEDCCDDCKNNLKPIKLKLQADEDLGSKSEERFVTVYKDEFKQVCSKCDSKYSISTININYSGGDDLLVLGPYDDVIVFAKEFREKFKQWTCENPSINISGGINIVGPKFPIGKAAAISDEYLDASKNCGKDKIKVFGEVTRWDDWGSSKGFNNLFDYGEKLENLIETKKLSKGMVYAMLHLWKSTFQDLNRNLNSEEDFKDNDIKLISRKNYVPKFKYKLRTVNSNVRDELDKEGLKLMPWIKIPVSWVSLRTR
ncbi:MAG: type III-A CRISPR-associated protein Cas10/Csm1 [Methanobacteriaceae archaeon]